MLIKENEKVDKSFLFRGYFGRFQNRHQLLMIIARIYNLVSFEK